MIAAAVTQVHKDTTSSKTEDTKSTDLILMVSSAISKLAEESSTVNASATKAEKNVSFSTDQQQIFAKLSIIAGRSKKGREGDSD